MYVPGLGYAEILRYINLVIQKVRGGSLCQKYSDKVKVGKHRLNDQLHNKRHTKYGIGEGNAYPLAVT